MAPAIFTTSMDFSDTYRQSSGLVVWSPDGRYLAAASMHRIIVRDAESLQIVQIWMCLDQIDYIEWSYNSQFILCALYKRALIQVWNLEQRDWTCKIDEGPAGLTKARWAPDGRHILSTSDFQLRITVWSLVDKSAKFFKYPKYSNRGLAFSGSGHFAAVLDRRDCRDGVTLIDTGKWEAVAHFFVDTQDAVDVTWAPDDASLLIWDSPMQYKCLHLTIDGNVLGSYCAYEDGLGIKKIEWSPSSDAVAVGSYDGQLRLLDKLTWEVEADYHHPSTLALPTSAVLYKEEEVDQPATPTDAPILTRAKYVIATLPMSLPTVTPDPERPSPRIGVGMVKWSHDGNYVATRCDSMPCVMWIWSIPKQSLTALLIQAHPIKQAHWCQADGMPRLALCTGTARVYLWSPAGCSVVDCPTTDFAVQQLMWRNDSSAVLLSDKTRYCVAWALHDDEG